MDSNYTDNQGLLYTIVDGSYCLGTNINVDFSGNYNNAGKNLNTSNVILPYIINGIKLTRIGAFSLRNNNVLKTIFIPKTIQSMEYDCFAYSTLVSIQFDDVPSIPALGRGVFYHCRDLKILQIPFSVTSIGLLAFGNTALQILTIPGKITQVNNYVFGSSGADLYKMPEQLRLNARFKRTDFGDFTGTITYIRFQNKQTGPVFQVMHCLFPLIICFLI